MNCLLDLDGVLINFIEGWERHHSIKLNKPWPVGVYDMPKVYDFPKEHFWDGIGEDFWVGLNFMPDAQNIIAIIEAYFPIDKICLISRTPYYEGSHAMGASGKIGWIERHMPQYLDRFLLGPAKHFLATPNNVLIDDWDKNASDFTRCGGHGILYPRLWNSRHAEASNSPQVLSRELASFMRNR